MGTIMKNGVSYGGSGTEVVANPQGEPTATLQKLKVGNSIYNVATSIIKLEDVTGATSSVSANTVSLMWSDPSDVKIISTGKNKIDTRKYYSFPQTRSGITYNKNDNGSIVMNGTATGASVKDITRWEDYFTLPKGKYILSDSWNKSGEYGTFISLYKGGTRIAQDIATTYGEGVVESEFDTSSYDYDSIAVGIYVAQEVSLNNLTIYPMIRSASELDPTWEPYTVSEVTLATWSGTKVVRKAGSAPASISDGTVVVDNKVRNQYSSSGFVDTGLQYDTTYYYRFFPYSTDGAITDGRSLTATPTRIVIENVPTQSGTLTYDGTIQTATFNDFDPSELDVSGNTGTNAGSYTAEFTPKNGYCWSDLTTTAKTVTWEIEKAAGSITLDKISISLDTTTLYSDVTITTVGDGELSVSSSDTSVATVGSIVNNVFRVSAEDAGNATVTVSMTASANYTAATATLPVTVSFISDVLNENTWAVISAASTAGTASSHWSVGDCKEITLNGTVGTKTYTNQSIYLYILGFDHNSSVEGSGISFGGFKTALTNGTDVCLDDSHYSSTNTSGAKWFNMNHQRSSASQYGHNYGGWKGTDIRYDILGSTDVAPSEYNTGSTYITTSRVGYDASSTCATNPVSNTLMAALPSDLRAVMKPITKYTDNTGNSSNVQSHVTASVDYLPLLAEYEVQGARSYANQYEQNSQRQYAYYANGNSKIKYKQSSTSSAAYWWLRSADYGGADGFCLVITDGSANSYFSRVSRGVCAALLV